MKTGWYSRSQWMQKFRPDGKGHITIADTVSPPETIEFTDIACDSCNADAGVDHEDGSEGRIYFTGSDSLCAPCGIKAEAQELQQVRDTLLARGWKQDEVERLTAQELGEFADNWRVERAAGVSAADVAKNLGWATGDVVYYAARLLEEANVHDLAKVLFDSLKEDQP